MSAMSDARCLAIINGRRPGDEELVVEWAGSAQETWNRLVEQCDLEKVVASEARWAGLARRCLLYMSQCVSMGGGSVYKVGITSHVHTRMRDHQRNPLVDWLEPQSVLCASRRTAAEAEAALLASAARAGWWCGGEWIAGCERTKRRLGITQTYKARDRRRRIRRLEAVALEATDGI